MRWEVKLGISTALLSAAALIGGCKSAGDTALHAVVTWQGQSVDQLEFTVTGAAGAASGAIVPATARPTTPGAPLGSPQDVIIKVRDDLDGTVVRCRVSALYQG